MKRIGISLGVPPPLPHHSLDAAFFAREAERLGFESFWCGEHIIAPAVVTKSVSPFFVDGQVPGFPDPLVMLARASAVTTRIKLGTSVLLLPEHNPLLLAKEVATLDHFSGGRFLMGVGAGWLREESEIMKVDFDHRWSQAIEAVRALKALWTQDAAEFHGKYYDFPPVRCHPKPVQKPHPPIFFGGVAPNVLRRVVAHGDGWAPERVTPELLKDRVKELRELARQAGRDPRSIPVSIHGKKPEPDLVAAFLEAGADRVVVGIPATHDEREARESLARAAALMDGVDRKFP